MYKVSRTKLNEFSNEITAKTNDLLNKWYILGQLSLISTFEIYIDAYESTGHTAIGIVDLRKLLEDCTNSNLLLQEAYDEVSIEQKGGKVIEFESISKKSKGRTSGKGKDS